MRVLKQRDEALQGIDIRVSSTRLLFHVILISYSTWTVIRPSGKEGRSLGRRFADKPASSRMLKFCGCLKLVELEMERDLSQYIVHVDVG